MFLDGGLRQAEPYGNFLVGQEGRKPQAFFLAGAEALRHSTLPYEENSYGVRTASSSVRRRGSNLSAAPRASSLDRLSRLFGAAPQASQFRRER